MPVGEPVSCFWLDVPTGNFHRNESHLRFPFKDPLFITVRVRQGKDGDSWSCPNQVTHTAPEGDITVALALVESHCIKLILLLVVLMSLGIIVVVESVDVFGCPPFSLVLYILYNSLFVHVILCITALLLFVLSSVIMSNSASHAQCVCACVWVSSLFVVVFCISMCHIESSAHLSLP